MALAIAARDDFAPLETFASIKLGLKTGADDFFFLEHLPDGVREADLISRRGTVIVRGLDNWIGEIARADLRPAILNPHQLFIGERRRLSLSKEPKYFYLCPRRGQLRYSLSDYVRLGELRGIHQRKLVQSNTSDGIWYRQVRSLVTSRWILPYNSAYDYGAWSNVGHYVLNGRFVGVDAHDLQDSDLLGAFLNSTFTAVGRLVEGVATGVEGAFDVGPPAARKIMIPDLRRLSAKGKESVLSVFREISEDDIMPAAPQRDASAPPARSALDKEILVALGMSPGRASALLDQLYSSYARWRANIEDVESQMRANRRQMSATGQNRTQKPIDIAARRVWEEIKHLLPLFPRAFLSTDEVLEVFNVPSTASLPASKPLFDVGIVRTKSKTINLGSHERVQYVAMLRTIGIVGAVDVPTSDARAGAIVELFEKERDKFILIASEHASKYVSNKDSLREVIEKVRNHWYSACRKDYHSGDVSTQARKNLS